MFIADYTLLLTYFTYIVLSCVNFFINEYDDDDDDDDVDIVTDLSMHAVIYSTLVK